MAAVYSIQHHFDKRRAMAQGLTIAGMAIGKFMWAPLTHWLITTYTWKGAFTIIGGIFLNGIVLGLLLKPKIHTETIQMEVEQQARNKEEKEELGQMTTTKSSLEPASVLAGVSNPGYVIDENLKKIIHINQQDSTISENHPSSKTSVAWSNIEIAMNQSNNSNFANQSHSNASGNKGNILNDFSSIQETPNQSSDEIQLVMIKSSGDSAWCGYCRQLLPVLTNWFFLVFCATYFLSGFGHILPLMWLPTLGTDTGASTEHAAWLVSATGKK